MGWRQTRPTPTSGDRLPWCPKQRVVCLCSVVRLELRTPVFPVLLDWVAEVEFQGQPPVDLDELRWVWGDRLAGEAERVGLVNRQRRPVEAAQGVLESDRKWGKPGLEDRAIEPGSAAQGER